MAPTPSLHIPIRMRRRASFARGPLPGTEDGHPSHEGVQWAPRAPDAPPPQPLADSLTAAHVRVLEVGFFPPGDTTSSSMSVP